MFKKKKKIKWDHIATYFQRHIVTTTKKKITSLHIYLHILSLMFPINKRMNTIPRKAVNQCIVIWRKKNQKA